ncbi:DNA repair RAD14 [Lecanosticta acicola]|uniref:DNA repair protein RAD14 n=1 Tax=Lecanosticta acicola TaxID=111012 RepID=A0AAI8YST3_9PEZI|nr:DNA repair RAD14 [Lecanosticta acicola]
MASTERPKTPPRPAPNHAANSPITPEQVRRMEESRLRAKALRTQQQNAGNANTTRASAAAVYPVTGQKRSHAAISTRDAPATNRDARNTPNKPNSNNGLAQANDDGVRAARKFQKFVEYDFSKMTDTKGGFMTHEDDPHNKTLHAPEEGKPANMTLREWEAQRLQKRLRDTRQGPYEPGLSALEGNKKLCRECGIPEIDWQWDELLGCQVCNTCKEKFPEKYSLLTKTEAKEDYLLTDPELRDEDLLPHLEKANPHKSTWNNMMLYLRFQVEEYAFSAKKWGSAEALDAEFERRSKEAKERKEKKFRNKLQELKKRTRVDAYKRGRAGGGGEFGDTIGQGKHEHEWGRSVEDPETGMLKKSCVECGMEVEELEL